MSNINYDKLYERYKVEYRKAAASQAEQGLTMANPHMYSRQQFEHYYNVVKKDTELRKIEGKLSRNTVIDTTMKIVKRQRYEVSYKQARAFQMAELNAGKQPTSVKKIMQGGADWDFVRNEYKRLKGQGLSGKAAKTALADLFYVYA